MRKEWSKEWKSSSQPRKQRKNRLNAPLHVKRRLTRSHLSKDLRKKYQKRGFSPIKGDTIKVMRGHFKGVSGKVEIVDVKLGIVKVVGIEVSRKDGNKSLVALQPSNLMITSLNLQDKARVKRLENTGNKSQESKKELSKEKKKVEAQPKSKVKSSENKESKKNKKEETDVKKELKESKIKEK